MSGEPDPRVFQILLVEDSAADVYLFRQALQAAALSVELTVLEDGSEALQFARREGKYASAGIPDLAVVDLNLPKTDGAMIAAAIRQNRVFSRVRIALMSSVQEQPEQTKGPELNIERYITKPADLKGYLEIGQVVKSMLMQEGKAVRISLVEDNPGDVYLLEKALDRHHIAYELTRYPDGDQAIKAFTGVGLASPDLILLDLKLPRREGFDVLHAVRSTPALMGVPVGILTSSDAAEDRHRAALIGSERYIRKPPTFEQYVDEVGRAIEDMLAEAV